MNDDIRTKVESFFSSYPKVRYSRDQILIFPDDNPKKVYHIVTGRVCQYSISYRGDEIIVNTFRSPAFFPMAMAINDIQNNFFYKAETETVMRVAPAEDVIAFIKHYPEVTYNLLSRVYSGVESILERMVHLMSGTAKSRLIFELIIEFRRFGDKNTSAGYLEINEANIAARSGLSRETVNREIKLLKERGIVAVNANKIFIKDISKLEKLLGTHI